MRIVYSLSLAALVARAPTPPQLSPVSADQPSCSACTSARALRTCNAGPGTTSRLSDPDLS